MNFFEIMGEMLAQSGFAALTWKNLVMFAISFILLYFASNRIWYVSCKPASGRFNERIRTMVHPGCSSYHVRRS